MAGSLFHFLCYLSLYFDTHIQSVYLSSIQGRLTVNSPAASAVTIGESIHLYNGPASHQRLCASA